MRFLIVSLLIFGGAYSSFLETKTFATGLMKLKELKDRIKSENLLESARQTAHIFIKPKAKKKSKGNKDDNQLINFEADSSMVFSDEVLEFIDDQIIPEFCDVTPDKCSLLNTFILDCNCVRKLSSMEGKCSNMLCETIKNVRNNAPDLLDDLLKSKNIPELVSHIGEMVDTLFGDAMCDCGSELSNALLGDGGCLPFYDGNVLYAIDECGTTSIIRRFVRNLDLSTLNKVMAKMAGHMCSKSKNGRCYNSMFSVMETLGGMVEDTITSYEDYEDASFFKKKKKFESSCSHFFRIFDKIEDIQEVDFDQAIEDIVEDIMKIGSDIMNEMACDKKCGPKLNKKMYACCFKDMVSDEDMFDDLEKFIESVVKNIHIGFEYSYTEFVEENESAKKYTDWSVPTRLRKILMEILHPQAQKSCVSKKGKSPKCFK